MKALEKIKEEAFDFNCIYYFWMGTFKGEKFRMDFFQRKPDLSKPWGNTLPKLKSTLCAQ